MKIFPIKDESSQRLVGFEFKQAYISLSNIQRLLLLNPEVSEVNVNSSIDPPGGIRVSFLAGRETYKIIEPFGDSSRYYVVTCDRGEQGLATIQELADMFESYKPTILERLIGGIFTLDFIRICSLREH